MLAPVRRRTALTCSIAALAIAYGALPGAARAETYVNATNIQIPGAYIGPATAGYPTSIDVAGVGGTISRVSVLLIDVDIGGNRDELDLALVRPGGQKVMLWSDACGIGGTVADQEFAFDDAFSPMANAGPCPPGAYAPSNYAGGAPEPDNLSMGGGPTAPFSSALAAFNGGSPNGTWSLYAYSDENGDFFDIGAWALTLQVQPFPQVPLLDTTGRRAAALAKCQKKRKKKARRKCRRKANQLPV